MLLIKLITQTVASSRHADGIQGVKYGQCDWCKKLFKFGDRSNKTFCDPPAPCKGNARKQRQRTASGTTKRRSQPQAQ